MDPRTETLLLALLDHPHQAEAIAAAYAAGDLDDLLGEADGGESPGTPDPDPPESPA